MQVIARIVPQGCSLGEGGSCNLDAVQLYGRRYKPGSNDRVAAQQVAVQLPQARRRYASKTERSCARSGQLHCRVGLPNRSRMASSWIKRAVVWHNLMSACGTHSAVARKQARPHAVFGRASPCPCRAKGRDSSGHDRAYRKRPGDARVGWLLTLVFWLRMD
jgi:hypothetical protein